MNYQSRYGFEAALGGAGSAASELVRRELVTTLLPRHLGRFEKLLAASPSGWPAWPSAVKVIPTPLVILY